MSLSFHRHHRSITRHRSLLALLCVVALAAASSPPPPHSSAMAAGQTARPAPGDQAADSQTGMPADLREAVERLRYRISESEDAARPGGYRALNPAQAFTTTFTDAGVRVRPHLASAQAEPAAALTTVATESVAAAAAESVEAEPAAGWQWGMSLRGYGYGERVQEAAPATLEAADNRIEYRRGELTEWYVNDRRGLEQGFTLAARPAGGERGEPLVVRLSVEGDLRAEDGADDQHISFVTESGARVLSYSKLAAFDARGATLVARMRIADGEVRLEVEDGGAEYPLTIDPLIALETKLTASNPAAYDHLGVSVAISGDTAVVGASRYLSDGAGSAYVFVRNSNGQWSQQAKLTVSGVSTFNLFGGSVAISGDTIVVGAAWGDSRAGENTGAAYVFVRTRPFVGWSQQAKLTASDAAAGDKFGLDVSISSGKSSSNPTIVVSAPENDGGAVYVFERSDGQWGQEAKFTASDVDSNKFSEANISGNTIVATCGGAVCVFVRNGTVWTKQAKFTPSDAPNYYHTSTAINGNTIVVGYDCDTEPPCMGAAYVFVRSGTAWTEQAKLTASDAAAWDSFGFSVAISGDTIVVGASGDDIYIVLSSSPPFPVIIKFVESAGSAYVFVRSNGQWSQQLKLTASDAAEYDGFGRSFAISGDTIVAGAPDKDSAAGQDAGAAYIKRLVDAVPY